MKYKYVMFDFDNTTVDSLDYWHYVQFKESFWKYGKKPDKNIINNMKTPNNNEKAKRFIDLNGINATVKEIRDFWDERMTLYYCTKIKMIKGIKEFLHYLKTKGYKILLVTASERDVVNIALEHFGLSDMYDDIITETEIGHTKSEIQFFEKLLKLLKVKPEELFFFEDYVKSVVNANSLGIDCVGVVHHLNKDKKPVLQSNSKLVIKNYKNKDIYSFF